MAQRSRNLDWNIQSDAAVAGVRIEVCIQVARQSQSNVSVAGMKIPAVRDFRSGRHLRIDAAVACLQRERIESAVNSQVSVARVRIVPGTGKWTINGREFEDYFPNALHRQIASEFHL